MNQGVGSREAARRVGINYRTAKYWRAAAKTVAVAAVPADPVTVSSRHLSLDDQGSEMHLHGQFTQAIGMPVCFCDPHAPCQRGSNENTNGLLRQYFPKGTDLAVHTAEHLDRVAAELNDRPRETLGWDSPAERMTGLLTTTD